MLAAVRIVLLTANKERDVTQVEVEMIQFRDGFKLVSGFMRGRVKEGQPTSVQAGPVQTSTFHARVSFFDHTHHDMDNDDILGMMIPSHCMRNLNLCLTLQDASSYRDSVRRLWTSGCFSA